MSRVVSLYARLLTVALASVLVAQAAAPRRLPRDLYKSGAAIRNAFRSIVESPNRATVVVLVDGRQKALGAIVAADGWVLTKARLRMYMPTRPPYLRKGDWICYECGNVIFKKKIKCNFVMMK